MPFLELPALVIDAVAATAATTRPVLVNRDPSPDEADVPLGTTIAIEIVDPGSDGVELEATRVWVDEVLAFDGGASPPVQASFGGPRAVVTKTDDTLRLVLDPLAPFASQAVVSVRVVSAIVGGANALNETYSFTAEDRTAPRLLAGVAIAPRTFRLVFDEPVVVTDASTITVAPLTAPAVPLTVVGVTVTDVVVEMLVTPEMTPDARYMVRATAVTDLHGNGGCPIAR